MRRRRQHAFDGRKSFRDEARDFLQRGAFDKNQKIITTRHQVAGLDLVEARDAFGQPVETATALGRDLHLDDRVNRGCCGGLAGEIEHRTPAEEDFIFLQLFQVLNDFGFGQTGDLRHLRSRQATTFEQQLENRVHRDSEETCVRCHKIAILLTMKPWPYVYQKKDGRWVCDTGIKVGTRKRAFFQAETAALEQAKTWRREHHMGGTIAALTDDQHLDAVNALKLLADRKVKSTLRDAVQFYLDRKYPLGGDITVTTALSAFLLEKELDTDLSEVYLWSFNRLERLREEFADTKLSALSGVLVEPRIAVKGLLLQTGQLVRPQLL